MKMRIFASIAGLALFAGLAAAQNQDSKQPPKISEPQRQAILKVQAAAQASNWDGMIQAITNLLENFPDTPYKHRMLIAAMQAAGNENNYEQLVVWGDRVIQDDPNDILARVQLADAIGQHTRENDLDKDQSLKKVEDYAHQALTLLQNANTAPPSVPLNDPAQWPAMKQQLTGEADYALAISAELKKNDADAQKLFQQAIAAEPTNGTFYVRLARIDIKLKQYDDAIAAAQKGIDAPNVAPTVKQIAEQEKAQATSLKASAK
jgi:tetratricopeptide (TPR) repeat protein